MSATTDPFSCVLPWHTGNSIELLPDGDQFFPRILAACNQATHHIDIEMYLVESGALMNQFISAFSAAIERGVQVRLLLDYFGAYGLSQHDVLLLRQRGVELRFFNRVRHFKHLHNLSRDHRKIILIDRCLAFVGGAGLTDDFSPHLSGPRAWRELMVEIHGPVVNDWQILFERVWAHHDDVYNEPLRQRLLRWQPVLSNVHHRNRNIPQARVTATRGLGNKPIVSALLSEIKKAESSVWISTAYFFPSSKLLKLLRKTARRGIDVRLLLPGPCTDHPGVRHAGQSWYQVLLRDGVHIHEYQPRFLHMKLALVDDWCSLGSCNFDRWNLRWNLEANLEVIDHRFANAVEAMLRNDFSQSVEYTFENWKQRSLLQRFREQFWRFVALFLSRLTQP